MKKFITASILALAFLTGCGDSSAPKQDMTQFNTQLGTFMTHKVGASAKVITANCAPLKNGTTDCRITIAAQNGEVGTGVAHNVRKVGAKFVWDHVS